MIIVVCCLSFLLSFVCWLSPFSYALCVLPSFSFVCFYQLLAHNVWIERSIVLSHSLPLLLFLNITFIQYPSLPLSLPSLLSLSLGGKVRYIKRRGQSNGAPTVTEEVLNGDEGLEEEDPNQRWPFPPTLDQFNLMDSDIDPSLIEQVLEDSR